MKTVLVTGGSRGIGKATVKEFAKNNYNVILNYNKSYEAAKEVENEYKNVKIFRADVSNPKDVQQMIAFANEQFGKIDILVNNAGIGCTGLLQDLSYDELIDCYKSICDFLDYIGKLKNEVKIEVKEEADQDEPELLC